MNISYPKFIYKYKIKLQQVTLGIINYFDKDFINRYNNSKFRVTITMSQATPLLKQISL